MEYLAVGIGGFLGSIFRYAISKLVISEKGVFPINTLIINILGSLIIGFIISYSLKNKAISPTVITMIKVGFCGGFTTFSTFSLETLELFNRGKYGVAILYIFLSISLSLLAAYYGGSVLK